MSGASGKVPAAIHVTPECFHGGALAKVRTGDLIRLDAKLGLLDVLVEQSTWESRIATKEAVEKNNNGMGRELFSVFRQNVNGADEGAQSLIGR
jgi:phosphogluconate dehydratase